MARGAPASLYMPCSPMCLWGPGPDPRWRLMLWTSSATGASSRWACETSIGIGLLGAAGATVTGMTDWSDVNPPARRPGLIHGLLNLTGAALFPTSRCFCEKRNLVRLVASLACWAMPLWAVQPTLAAGWCMSTE